MNFLLIVFIIILLSDNSKLKKEIEILKRNSQSQNMNFINNQSNYNESMQNQVGNSINIIPPTEQTNNIQATNSNVVKNNFQNKKNPSALFIAGAILIVLAAIVFLASSWLFLSSIGKVFILLIVQLLFTFLSKICLEKFSLEKTSKVFKYLSLIFIPIILISLSFFELVGYYFSPYSEGFLLYCSITFLITSIIYKLISHKKTDLFLSRTSVILEIICLTFFINYLNCTFETYLFLMTIYNIIIYILLQGNYLDNKTYKIINIILTYTLLIISIYLSYLDKSLIASTNIVLFSLLHLYKFIKSNNISEEKTNLTFCTLCYILSLNIINILTDSFTPLYILIGLLPLFIFSYYLKEKDLKDIIINIVTVIASLIIIQVIFTPDKTILFILSFILSAIIYIISFLLAKNKIFKYLSYFNLSLILFSICYVYEINEVSKYVPLLVALIIYGLEKLYPKLRDNSSIKLILIILSLESLLLINSYTILIPLIFTLLLIKLEKENDNFLFLPILTSFSILFFEDNFLPQIYSFITIITLTIFSIYKKKINLFSILSFISIILSTIAFTYNISILFIILLIWGFNHIYFNKSEKNTIYKIICLLSTLGLYIKLLIYLDIDLSSMYALGCYSSLIILTRFIISDKFVDNKFIEYYFFAVITFIALFNVYNFVDGLLLTIFIFMISLISYSLKYDSYLKVSIVFIIINILALSSKYWFKIPWYIYILLIGISFLTLAIHEEKKKSKDNKVSKK